MREVFRQARIYVQGDLAGLLRETDDGYEFQYDLQYLQKAKALAVSLTLPVRQEPFRSPTLFAFFDGLIPEGWLLDIAIHNWKLDANDRFGLLMHTCRDCIGDVRVEEAADAV